MDGHDELVVFQGKRVRRTWHEGQWHFSVVDVVGALADSTIPRRYWADLKAKLTEEGFELYEKIVQLKMTSADGKSYATDCASTPAIPANLSRRGVCPYEFNSTTGFPP